MKAIIVMADSGCHLFFYWHNQRKTASEYQEKVDEIQPLLYYAGAIMGGYVKADEGSCLSLYNGIEGYPDKTINNIYVDIFPLKVDYDGKKGYVDVKYVWAYYNDADPVAISGAPSRWFIEKHEGRWEVVRIAEEP